MSDLHPITIAGRRIGPGEPIYVIAELSANHSHRLEKAVELVHAAADAGADAVKLQTYTPDTITINSDREFFRIQAGTVWDGRTLYELYSEAFTPWEWHERLLDEARSLGMALFSSPFDPSAVEFLERLGVPAFKIASPELVDVGLIQLASRTGKPLIMSTGMADLAEIDEAVKAARAAGAEQIVLLKCTSAYPAPPAEANLRTIPDMSRAFEVPVGLSDHTLGTAVAVAAVALDAVIIEKHLTLSRSIDSPDSGFSLEPQEFRTMVEEIRVVESALGHVSYAPTPHEERSRILRRSLFVVQDVKAGELLTDANVRSIRPGHGLHTRYLAGVIGRRAATDIPRGTPLAWNLVSGPNP